MSETETFRQYAKEAIAASSASIDENDRQDFAELAALWMRAASQSELMFKSPVSLPHADEATPLTRF